MSEISYCVNETTQIKGENWVTASEKNERLKLEVKEESEFVEMLDSMLSELQIYG